MWDLAGEGVCLQEGASGSCSVSPHRSLCGDAGDCGKGAQTPEWPLKERIRPLEARADTTQGQGTAALRTCEHVQSPLQGIHMVLLVSLCDFSVNGEERSAIITWGSGNMFNLLKDLNCENPENH